MTWEKVDQKIKKQFVFKNQTELAEVVLLLARHSDKVGHHADLDIRYNKLNVSITTHDAGGLTEKDYALADEIDRLIN